MDEKSLVRTEAGPMTLDEVIGQVSLIQEIMKNVMREGEHYGIIPGTKKPSLYKPGAEKLCLTFHLEPDYELINPIRERDFISYTIKCTLFPMKVTGLGSCNSRETKYRYRSDNTGRPVPQEYWKNRDSSILGGSQYTIRKKDKQWFIFEQVDNDNPWDLDNTLLKMACKRSLTAATLNATAASDIFTQDLEDLGGRDKNKDEDVIDAEVEEKSENTSQDSKTPPQSTKGSNKIHCPKYKKEILKAACNTCNEKEKCTSRATPEKETSTKDEAPPYKGLTILKFSKWMKDNMDNIPAMSQEDKDAIRTEHQRHFPDRPYPLDEVPEEKDEPPVEDKAEEPELSDEAKILSYVDGSEPDGMGVVLVPCPNRGDSQIKSSMCDPCMYKAREGCLTWENYDSQVGE